MANLHESLSETHIVGDDTHQSIVRAEECPALAQRQISHVGVGDAAVPYKIVRTHLSGTYVHASLGGEGRILLDGRWRPHRAGMVSLAPAHVLHAFHAIPSKRWQYCWVRYLPTSPRSSIRFMAPVMAQFDPQPLNHAILGFIREFHAGNNTSSAMLWIDLIEHYISRFAEPLQREDRLRAVWEAVQADLCPSMDHREAGRESKDQRRTSAAAVPAEPRPQPDAATDVSANAICGAPAGDDQ